MAGLTVAGFERARLPEIKAAIEAAIRAELGDDTDLAAQSVLGQLVGEVSDVYSQLWELAEHVYLSQYAGSAEGVALQQAASLVGAVPLGESHSFVILSATGDEGTTVPAGSLVRGADEQFETRADVEITQDAADRLLVNVTSAVLGNTYTITLDGTPISVVAASAVAAQIAEQLAAAITAEPTPATATSDGAAIELLAKGPPFQATVGAGLAIAEVASQLRADAVNPGPIDVSAGTLVNIVTPVAGWDAVTNRFDGTLGRLVEADADLRQRRQVAVRGAGSASPNAILQRLQQSVPGILSVALYENRSDEVDAFGRPPHSFEVVIDGGDDEAVADIIWKQKPAGIETFGNVTVTVTDAAGQAQDVNFSRPAARYVWVRATITDFYTEEAFPSDGVTLMQNAIALQGNRLKIGENVIRQRLLAAVYSVPGLQDVTLELATSATAAGPPGAYSAANLPIGPAQRARFAANRVSVVLP